MSARHGATFAQMANRLPELEVRMPLMFDVMVSGGRLDGPAFVRLNRLEPARVHGLQGKGDIATGFDADIVIRDPKRRVTFGADDLHDNVGYTPGKAEP